MAISLVVRYYVNENTTNRQAYGLRLVVANAVDMPKEIFVFQRIVPSAMDVQENSLGDIFIKVAGPNDLEEYPIVPPGPEIENPYYRSAEVTVLFRSYTELVETKELLHTCISALVLAMKDAASLTEMEEVTYE